MTAAEKAIFTAPVNGGVTITGAYGYLAGSDVPVFSKTYALAGTLSPTSAFQTPGDVAALVRFSTADRTTKNHPLYLFNYYHAALAQNNPLTVDNLNTGQRTAMQTYAAAWVTGFNDGSINRVRCGPNGNVATGSSVNALLTHRDFPRG